MFYMLLMLIDGMQISPRNSGTTSTDFGVRDCTCSSHLFFSTYYDDLLYYLKCFKKVKIKSKKIHNPVN